MAYRIDLSRVELYIKSKSRRRRRAKITMYANLWQVSIKIIDSDRTGH